MRRVLLLALFAALALSAQAARRITIDQLRQMLVSRLAAHQSDSSLAQRLSSQELSEQLTSLTLQRLTSELKPGRQTVLALDLLADTSAFLEPPPGELPHLEPPDAAAREFMLNAAGNFARVTLQHLPNFLATRITRSYDNTPLFAMRDGSSPQSTYLHSSGTLSQKSLIAMDMRWSAIHPAHQSRIQPRQTLLVAFAQRANSDPCWRLFLPIRPRAL